jgi:hypothetical protein
MSDKICVGVSKLTPEVIDRLNVRDTQQYGAHDRANEHCPDPETGESVTTTESPPYNTYVASMGA